MFILIGMIVKLKRAKKITFILFACVLSFFIMDNIVINRSSGFSSQLNSLFKYQTSIHFDRHTSQNDRVKYLKDLALQYPLCFNCIDIENDGQEYHYYVGDSIGKIQFKTHKLGSFIHNQYSYYVDSIEQNKTSISDFIILAADNMEAIKNTLRTNPTIIIDEHSSVKHPTKNIKEQYYFLFEKILPYFIILLTIYIMIEYGLFHKTKKVYAIEKIHGLAPFAILQKKCLSDILSFSFIYWIVSLAFIYGLGFQDNPKTALLSMSAVVYSLMIVVFLLIDLLEVYCIKILNIKNTLKNKINTKLYSIVSILFKVVSIFFIVIQLGNLVDQSYTLYTQLREIKVIQEKTQMMVKIEGTNPLNSLSNEQVVKEMEKLERLAGDQKAIFLDASSYYLKQEHKSTYDPLTYLKRAIILDENTVEFFKIKDENGHLLKITKTKTKQERYDHPILLVPTNKKNNPELISFLSSTGSHYKVIYIMPHQRIYSYRPELGKIDHGWVTDAYLLVDGNVDLNQALIPVHNKDVKEGFKSLLKRYGIEDETFVYIRPYQAFNNQIQLLKLKMRQTFIRTLFSLFLVILVLYQSIVTYYKSHMNRILILKVHGHSFIETYDFYFLMDLCIYVCLAILLAILAQPVGVGVLIVVYIMNLLIALMMIHRIEKTKIISYLKGEDS